jgi:hypothetical protein
LTTLNHKIPLQWLNLSIDTFKVKCKTLFLWMNIKLLIICLF